MKNYTQSTTAQIAKQVDNELKKILLADLKSFKVKNQFVTAPVIQLHTVSAA